MLQKMRDQTQSLGFKILVGAIVFVLAVFGFGTFNLFVDADPEVASIGGSEITERQLQREVELETRRLASQYGDSFDPSLIDTAAIRSQVLQRLVGRTLLTDAASNFGIGASKEHVERRILGDANFQNTNGRFDEQRYQMLVTSMGYSPVDYMEELNRQVAIEHLRSGFSDTAFLLEWEETVLAGLSSQTRDLAYLTFAVNEFVDQVELADDLVRLHYEENQADYMTEERVDVEFVVLDLQSVMDDPEAAVTEDDLLDAYEREKAEFDPQEQRRGSHILLSLNDERDEAAAIEEVQQIRERLLAGESFAELAEQLSDDPGSAANGGDLGLAGKGVFVPPFENALWALQPGELSEPVVSEFGVHLIRLEAIEMPEYPSLEQRREVLELQLQRRIAVPLFSERVREMDRIAFDQYTSLQPLVDQFGLLIQTMAGVTAAAGEGVFSNPDVRDALFDEDVLNGNNSPAITIGEDRAVVARVTQFFESEIVPFEDVAEQIRRDLKREEAALMADASLEEALERLRRGEATGAVANDYGLQWQTAANARRTQPTVPRSVLTTAFEMPRPADGDKSVGVDDISRSLITVTRVRDPDITEMSEAELSSLSQYFSQRAANLDFSSLYDSLEADTNIRYP